MSAFVCGPLHIGQMAAHLVRHQSDTLGDADASLQGANDSSAEALAEQVAARLAEQNVDSVAYRYEEDREDCCSGYPGGYNGYVEECVAQALQHLESGVDLPFGVLWKMSSCYEYQSCENEGWDATVGVRLSRMLSGGAERAMGAASCGDPAPDTSNPVFAPEDIGRMAAYLQHHTPEGAAALAAELRGGGLQLPAADNLRTLADALATHCLDRPAGGGQSGTAIVHGGSLGYRTRCQTAALRCAEQHDLPEHGAAWALARGYMEHSASTPAAEQQQGYIVADHIDYVAMASMAKVYGAEGVWELRGDTELADATPAAGPQ